MSQDFLLGFSSAMYELKPSFAMKYEGRKDLVLKPSGYFDAIALQFNQKVYRPQQFIEGSLMLYVRGSMPVAKVKLRYIVLNFLGKKL